MSPAVDGELKERLGKYLPAPDAVLSSASPAIEAGIEGFSVSVAALAQARTAEVLAATDLSTATEAWHKQMEKTYGVLVAEVGKAKAKRFFPRSKGKAKGKKTKKDPTPA
jgi:hypothetical protein